jgi:prophage regulatory protein
MASNKRTLTLDEVKRQAEYFDGMVEDWKEETALESHFRKVTSTKLVEMFESDKNEDGKRMTRFERTALSIEWMKRFGCAPPWDATGSSTSATKPAEPEPDGPLLTMRDVIKMTSVSKSSIKRWINDKDFPRPIKLSPRRIAWHKKDVVAWIEQRR